MPLRWRAEPGGDPLPFGRYIGVDFSAAADGARKTWIALGEPRGNRLAITGLVPARDLPGCTGAEPAGFLPALGGFLAAQRDTLAGLDFPFSLPAELIGTEDWISFATGFAARFPDAESFCGDGRRHGDGRELRRRCDRESRAPFSVHNLRLYRQTFHGIGGLLAPLAAERRVRVAPLFLPNGPSVTLAEICPASTGKRLRWPRGYKGRAERQQATRAALLACLAGEGVTVPEPFAATALADPGGDALDAMIAGFAAWRTGRTPDLLQPRDRLDRIEGRIYF